jgi:hypothetical protein
MCNKVTDDLARKEVYEMPKTTTHTGQGMSSRGEPFRTILDLGILRNMTDSQAAEAIKNSMAVMWDRPKDNTPIIEKLPGARVIHTEVIEYPHLQGIMIYFRLPTGEVIPMPIEVNEDQDPLTITAKHEEVKQ